MKVALIGYGKMGRMIEAIALKRGHQIVEVIDEHNTSDLEGEAFSSADVAIEFTRPDAALGNVMACFRAGVPVVSGTTGWTSAAGDLEKLCLDNSGTLLWASNFSIGVNLFRDINRRLASLMGHFPEYTPSLTETHHIHKLDHPSGTAITLAEEIIENHPEISKWEEPAPVTPEPGVLPITALREGEVPGIHSITWDSPADSITITHSAKSREGFALGAVIAAEWLASKKGLHTISEMYADILS